jgi:hypothetical protein
LAAPVVNKIHDIKESGTITDGYKSPNGFVQVRISHGRGYGTSMHIHPLKRQDPIPQGRSQPAGHARVQSIVGSLVAALAHAQREASIIGHGPRG